MIRSFNTLILSILFFIQLSNFALAKNDDIQLNLQNADLKAFIETVAKITQKNILYDANISGNVSLVTPNKLNKSQLYDVFLAVLQSQGYSAKQNSQGIIQVSLNKNSNTNYLGFDALTKAHSLVHLTPEQALAVIKPLLPDSAVASATKSMVIISCRILTAISGGGLRNCNCGVKKKDG